MVFRLPQSVADVFLRLPQNLAYVILKLPLKLKLSKCGLKTALINLADVGLRLP